MIFYDPSESREGTRLPQSIILSGQELPNLEKYTGADLLLSPLSEPKMKTLSDLKPHQIALRKHCEDGMLIQRKSAGDIVNSITKMENIQARMQEWTDSPWLVWIGEIGCDSVGKAIVNSRECGWDYGAIVMSSCWWQMRGGYFAWLCRDAMLPGWIANMHKALAETHKKKEKMVTPRVTKQSLYLPHTQDERGYFEDAVRQVFGVFPGVGPKTANSIAEACGSVRFAVSELSREKPRIRIEGLGEERLRGIRYFMGFEGGDELCLEIREKEDNKDET